MERIAFIIPYFGSFNNYFPLWLKSCESNKAIADFYIFTDIAYTLSIPQNVKFVPITFTELKAKIQAIYDFPISLNQPYKFCDFRPAYGEIFQDYIRDYSHWAFGDNDLIWGDWNATLPKNWRTMDRIGEFGHLTIIQNSIKMRLLYRFNNAYRIAFQTPYNTFFDENAFNKICRINHIPITPLKIADCDPRRLTIRIQNQTYDHHSGLFSYDNGHIYQLFKKKDSIGKEEFTYIHFLKRKMKTSIKEPLKKNKFYIYQREIVSQSESSTITELINICERQYFYWSYWLKFLNPKVLFNSIYYKINLERKDVIRSIDKVLTHGIQ